MAHTIELQYFKPSGKYYSSGEYISLKDNSYDVHEEVRKMMKERKLPDLVNGHSNYTVYVRFSYPAILHPE